jgi:hypothetical protein
LLPCNVVVRADGCERTIVEAVDPRVLVELTGNTELQRVAESASAKLSAVLASLNDAA